MTARAIQAADGTKVEGESLTNARDRLRFLRYSHIFSAVVREVLELKILRRVSAHPLALSQFHLLKLISLKGQHQVGQVASFLGVSAPAASKNIDKLERLGLVIRRQSTSDRRATLLEPSPEGRRLVEDFETLKSAQLEPVLSQFDSTEVRQLTHLLERFSLALMASEEPGEGLCFRCAAYFEDNCPILHYHQDCPYQTLRKVPENQSASRGD
jgi:DNA-binding MarR family transcriptional regulator